LDKTHFFNLINVGNISSGLLSENFVQSPEDFLNFPINLKGLPILIAADPAVFEFSSEDVFELSDNEILTKVYGFMVYREVGKALHLPSVKNLLPMLSCWMATMFVNM
jgi:hypothetical protein